MKVRISVCMRGYEVKDSSRLLSLRGFLSGEHVEYELNKNMPGWIYKDQQWLEFDSEVIELEAGLDFSSDTDSGRKLRDIKARGSEYIIQASVYDSQGNLVPYNSEELVCQ